MTRFAFCGKSSGSDDAMPLSCRPGGSQRAFGSSNEAKARAPDALRGAPEEGAPRELLPAKLRSEFVHGNLEAGDRFHAG